MTVRSGREYLSLLVLSQFVRKVVVIVVRGNITQQIRNLIRGNRAPGPPQITGGKPVGMPVLIVLAFRVIKGPVG